jgi:hypothetical protein
LLPEGVQKHLPSFLSGPSVGEQLTAERQNVEAAEAKAGHPLSLKERLAAEPVMQSPAAVGFATHQVGELPGAIAGSAEASANKFIDSAYTRAVKPGVGGKGTAGAVDRYMDQAKSAISSIVGNKANLKFTDPAGQVTAGELPKSLHQFSESIEQTKGEIFKKYDTMAQQAGAQGARVDLYPVVSELRNLAGKKWLQDLDPAVAKYANDTADNLASQTHYSTADAQDAIQHINAKLSGFYGRGAPGGVDAAVANIQATIASKLRQGLDATIESYQGPGYQELRSQYGGLKAIEKHVANRAQVVARQEPGGILSKFANAGSIAEILHGLALANPEALIRGVGLKGGQLLVERLRNPDRAVSKLFEAAEGQQSPPPPPIVPGIPLSPVLPQQNQGADAMGLRSDAMGLQMAGDVLPFPGGIPMITGRSVNKWDESFPISGEHANTNQSLEQVLDSLRRSLIPGPRPVG